MSYKYLNELQKEVDDMQLRAEADRQEKDRVWYYLKFNV